MGMQLSANVLRLMCTERNCRDESADSELPGWHRASHSTSLHSITALEHLQDEKGDNDFLQLLSH